MSFIRSSSVGLILPGGAARGAYEAGVVRYLLEDVAHTLGRPVRPQILCGTSVGAISACVLAAFADERDGGGVRLERLWGALRVDQVLRPHGARILALLCGLLHRAPKRPTNAGGVLDSRAIGRLLRGSVPFERISVNLSKGLLDAVAVPATRVATGHTVVFVQQRHRTSLHWPRERTLSARATHLGPQHAMASSAIPLLFPAVRIGGELFCEGGLRQNVPLLPTLRLGAERLVVVSPHRIVPRPHEARENEAAFGDPLFLLGKTLNALLLDRVDEDVDRLTQLNAVLAAGSRRFGPTFVDQLNAELAPTGEAALRRVEAVVIRASRDLGQMAAELVLSPEFSRRVKGLVGRVLRRLAEAGAAAEADLLSYLLFDGEYAARLMELGRADARAHHEALCRAFSDGAGRALAGGATWAP